MVQGKKGSDMSNGNQKYQQPNTPFQRKDMADTPKGRQNGNASSFRTDSAISGSRNQNERVLQRWVPDAPADIDGSLESTRMRSTGGAAWDQFAENERRFGLKTDYDENIYTTAIDKNHPQYKQRLADAEKKAREIERSVTNNSHVAEERIQNNLAAEENGLDEEDKYSGVRRQDFPPLSSSNNKYTPPARRAPTGQSTVSGAPVDPAIISSQLARPDKPAVEKNKTPAAPKQPKPEAATPPATTESSVAATPEPKRPVASIPSVTSTSMNSTNRTASPQTKTEPPPNATATVERDVATAFKNFAASQRKNVENSRNARARNDKEIKLNDLKKFADNFKLNTPVPSDLVSIIAKDPAKQKEIQEKAKRNAEEAKINPSEGVKPIPLPTETRPSQRPVPATHGTSPSNIPSRQNTSRNPGFAHQSSNYRASSQVPQPANQQTRTTVGGLGNRLRSIEQSKSSQLPQPAPIPAHETRQPPTGPANNNTDPNFSRRSSGVASAQGLRLNPTISEFRPSPHAATFNPNNPSSGSSPRSAVDAVAPAPTSRSLLSRKPIPDSERPTFDGKFNALAFIKTIKPPAEKNWSYTGGIKPAYDTHPLWRTPTGDEKPESPMLMTYVKQFEMTPFPPQTMSSPNPSHVIPQPPHQHQLPFHMQNNMHNMGSRQSPRQPPMGLHGNQHHGPTPPFNDHDGHRMMPSHSAQSFGQSPRIQNVPMPYPSPMGQPAQMAAYNAQILPQFPGGPPMPPYRSLSSSHQFGPQQAHMGPIMMQNPNATFLTSQGMAPGPPLMYGPPGGQGAPFMQPAMQPGNGPPQMPGVNGFPSPGGRPVAPMMMNQGSQQGHGQPMYGMNPGMSPGPQFGNVAPIYAQQPPGQMQMRGYGGPNQFGTSPQQMHNNFGPQQHRNHPNGNYNNKNFQGQGPHQSSPANGQVPNGPQARAAEGSEETK